MTKTVLVLLLLLLPRGPGFGAVSLASPTWDLVGGPKNVALETVAAEGVPGGNATALRVTVRRPSDPFWDIEISQVIVPVVPANDRLCLVFWARSGTRNPIRAVLERAVAPYDAVLMGTPMLTPQWQRYELVGTLGTSFGPNGLGLRFQMGQQAGTVELAGVRLEDLGTDPAVAAARAAITPAAEQARIRRFRMADLTVIVRDRRGRPVPGVRVHIQMTRHAFLFGCNFFGLDPNDNSPLQDAYRSQFAALFN